ncbi:unnamed protein product [Closterium sp. Yama58-4]|nr:unnamed protein product [Closterium sp. Yama58-4]
MWCCWVVAAWVTGTLDGAVRWNVVLLGGRCMGHRYSGWCSTMECGAVGWSLHGSQFDGMWCCWVVAAWVTGTLDGAVRWNVVLLGGRCMGHSTMECGAVGWSLHGSQYDGMWCCWVVAAWVTGTLDGAVRWNVVLLGGRCMGHSTMECGAVGWSLHGSQVLWMVQYDGMWCCWVVAAWVTGTLDGAVRWNVVLLGGRCMGHRYSGWCSTMECGAVGWSLHGSQYDGMWCCWVVAAWVTGTLDGAVRWNVVLLGGRCMGHSTMECGAVGWSLHGSQVLWMVQYDGMWCCWVVAAWVTGTLDGAVRWNVVLLGGRCMGHRYSGWCGTMECGAVGWSLHGSQPSSLCEVLPSSPPLPSSPALSPSLCFTQLFSLPPFLPLSPHFLPPPSPFTPPPILPLPASPPPPRYVAFVSGLHLSVPTTTASGAPSPSPPPAATPPSSQGRGAEGAEAGGGGDAMLHEEMLLDLLSGHVHSEEEERLSAGIVRVVIAGDSCSFSHLPQSLHDTVNSTSLMHRDAKAMAAPVKALDTFLSELSASVPVDIIPGSCDPANYSLPQQVGEGANVEVKVPGKAGQNIQDMRRLCLTRLLHAPPPAAVPVGGEQAGPMEGVEMQEGGKDGRGDDREERGEDEKEGEAGVLDLMQRCLEWRHVAPSAPDTLGVYPFQLDDPFVLTTCPHVFFAGNQPRFATRLIRGPQKQVVRLVAIPKFSETSLSFLICPVLPHLPSPSSSALSFLICPVLPHLPSSALSFLICPLLPHLPCPSSSALSFLICPLLPHLPSPSSSALSFLICPVLPHLSCPSSSVLSFLIFPLLPHLPSPSSSALSFLFCPLLPHLPSPSSSALSFLICPLLPHLPSPSSSALSFLVFLTQVDLDSLECRVLSVACPPFPSSPSRSS